MQELFDLALVRSEFELHGLRIDTLAFDKESGAFVIIEYKKDRNFSVVDQGVAYLNLVSILADIHTGMETNVQIIRIETIPILIETVDQLSLELSRIYFAAALIDLLMLCCL